MRKTPKKFALIIYDDVIAVGEASGKRSIEVLDSLVEQIMWIVRGKVSKK